MERHLTQVLPVATFTITYAAYSPTKTFMNYRPAPYEYVIRTASFLLFACWIAAYFYPSAMAGWPLTVMLALAVVIYAMVALEIYQLTERIRAGQLYFLRTISFYVNFGLLAFVIGSFLADVFLGAGGAGSWRSSFILIALLTGYWSQSFPYIHVDAVRFTHRMGATTTTFPLFNISGVSETEEGLVISVRDGYEVEVYQSSLPQRQYAELRSRLLSL